VRDIGAHIDGALAESGDPAVVPAVLDSLGTPREIADAAYAEMPARVAPRMAGRDVAAVVLVLAGGFVFGIGWFVGIVLLWTSPVWRVRDKLVGTLLVPGGLAGTVLLAGLAVAIPVNGGLAPSLGIALLVVVVVGPLFTTFWLIRTARRRPAQL
jgi:hypothetical protein